MISHDEPTAHRFNPIASDSSCVRHRDVGPKATICDDLVIVVHLVPDHAKSGVTPGRTAIPHVVNSERPHPLDDVRGSRVAFTTALTKIRIEAENPARSKQTLSGAPPRIRRPPLLEKQSHSNFPTTMAGGCGKASLLRLLYVAKRIQFQHSHTGALLAVATGRPFDSTPDSTTNSTMNDSEDSVWTETNAPTAPFSHRTSRAPSSR